MRHRLLKNSSRSAALPDLFFRLLQREVSYRSADRRFAHPHSHHGEQELGPLGVGGPGSLLEVLDKELPRLLVEFRCLAGSLPRLQGAVLIEPFAVALDRRSVNAETPSGLTLGNALLNRLDDLLSEIQRVCFHVSALPGTTSSQPAVTQHNHSGEVLAFTAEE